MLFLSFKEGFVRWHIDYFVFIATQLQLLILVAILAPRRGSQPTPGPARLNQATIMTAAFWRRRIPSLALALTGAVLFAPVVSTMLSLQSVNPPWPADSLGARIATYQKATAMLQSSAERDRVAKQAQAIVLADDPLPAAFVDRIGSAPVDVMPWDIEVMTAYHLNWAPRPVLQSYTSYTSYLDNLDASFLRGPDAPVYVIATFRLLGHRYPLYEEPATQRALFERYRVDAVDPNWVLLRRASDLCPCPTRELGSTTAAAGQAVTPPAAAPGERVFVRVRLDYSLAGRAADLLLDAGAIRITLASGGTETRFRLVPGTAGDGLLLSAFARNNADLATVYSGCDTGPAVSSIRVAADDPAMFASTVTYEFFAEREGSCTTPQQG
jgi:hypothetical protein